MRSATITRKTNETDITVIVWLDNLKTRTNDTVASGDVIAAGDGPKSPDITRIETGCGFLNHMLTLFAFHSGFTMQIMAGGDTDVDYHHLTEDIGITLGMCLKKALGDTAGITRYASLFLPMDEALAMVALDISGRAYLNYDVEIGPAKVGDFDTELAEDFLLALCRSLGLTLHVKLMYGVNAHHIIEAIFKGLGRALREAVKINPSAKTVIPSSKGIII
jgi:imidazoleglycerol-phosphate dehydratase